MFQRIALSVLASAVVCTAIAQNPSNPVALMTATAKPQQVMMDIAGYVELNTASTALTTEELIRDSAPGWFAASTACFGLAADISNASTAPGVRPAVADALASAFTTLGNGYAAVANDFGNGSPYGGAGFHTLSSGFVDLALFLPYVDSGFNASTTPILYAADAMTAIGNYLSPTGIVAADNLPPHFLELRAIHTDIATSMMLDANLQAGQRSTGAGCPASHPFRGCTSYVTTSYTSTGCDGWSVTVGGIGVGGIVSIDVFADCGLWRRRCHYSTTISTKCVCVCYGSRWDRFWASGGINKTVTVTASTGTATIWDYAWSCGTPTSAPPAPGSSLDVGGGGGC